MDPFEEKLAEVVRGHEHLYNATRRDHKDTWKADNSWREIAESLSTEERVCRKSWRYLRDKFAKAKRRREKKSDDPPPRLYVELQWLDVHIKHRGTNTNVTVGPQQTPQPTQSHQLNPWPGRRVSVGTQTFSPERPRSVDTQLPVTTLKSQSRSTATQTTEDAGTTHLETEIQHSSSSVKASECQRGVRPAKRARFECSEKKHEDDGEDSLHVPHLHSSTHEPCDSMTELSEINVMESDREYQDTKYIVFESCLRELFEICPDCKQECKVQRQRMGTFVSFSQLCPNCPYTRKWQSQPIRGSTPVGDLQLSAAIYFSGGSFNQVEKICKATQLQVFKHDAFKRHSRMFLEPTIYCHWKREQQDLLYHLQQNSQIALGGDLRTDSQADNAKYGSYSLMHLDTNKIVDVQLVQSKDVGGRTHMEREALKRGLDLLQAKNIRVDYMVTDRRRQVQKYLRERRITQGLDVWHLEKSLSKKLQAVAKKKECFVVKKWLASIKNHMYWSASSSKSGPEMVAKWKSMINHIQNIHQHNDPLFPRCAHPDRISRDPSKWLPPGSMALHKVEKLLTNRRILADVEKLSHKYQISSIEAFHGVILKFTPRKIAFSSSEMLCRLYLSAMYFNETIGRGQTAESDIDCTVKPVTPAPPYNYVRDLMTLLFDQVFGDPSSYVDELRKIVNPEKMSAQAGVPSKTELIASCTTGQTTTVGTVGQTSQRDLGTPGIYDEQSQTEL